MSVTITVTVNVVLGTSNKYNFFLGKEQPRLADKSLSKVYCHDMS